jgi:hypothetical protein
VKLRLGVLAGCWAFRALVSVLAAAPLAIAGARIVGAHPRGDAVLFDEGGMWLLETGRLLGPQMPAVAGGAGAVLLLAAFAWLVPFGALVASVEPGAAERSGAELLRRGAGAFGPLALLLGAFWLVEVVVLALGGLAARSFDATWARVAVAAGTLGAAWVVAVLHDLARIACVHRQRGVLLAAADAVLAIAARPRLLWAASWRSLLAVAAMIAATWAALSAARGSAAATVLLPELGVGAVLLLRADWLRSAARLGERRD